MKYDVILYGAGIKLPYVYSELKNVYNIVCIADKDERKQGLEIEMPDVIKLKVFSIEDSLNRFSLAKIWITPAVPVKFEIITELTVMLGIDKERILNYEAVTYRKGCQKIENNLLVGQNLLSFCCETIEGRPQPTLWFDDDISCEDLYKLFNEFKIRTVKRLNSPKPPKGCIDCRHIETRWWKNNDEKIVVITFDEASGGVVCQFKCVYCTIRKNFIPENTAKAEKILAFLEYLKTSGKLDEQTAFILSLGEITVSPFRKRIFELVRNFRCDINTNSELYSKEIAEKLTDKRSRVQISLDSGTAETFKAIKGRDCFEKVCKNIQKYSKIGNVILKYIILPGLNDNEKDVKGFIKIAVKVGAEIALSRDFYDVKKFDENIETCIETAKLIISSAEESKLKITSWLNDVIPKSAFEERIKRLY